MPRKLRELRLRADLRRNGWSIARQSGTSHQIWKHPLIPDREINLVGQDGKDADCYQERDVREGVRRAQAAQQQKGQQP